jgi:hypothetical protein
MACTVRPGARRVQSVLVFAVFGVKFGEGLWRGVWAPGRGGAEGSEPSRLDKFIYPG